MIRVNTLQGFENVSPIYHVTKDGEILSEYLNMKPISKRLTKPTKKSKNEYYEVCLMTKDGGKLYRKIHRIVAIAFVDGDISLQVNHKDENGLNNHYLNLEWMTAKENSRYSNAKKVYQYDSNGLVRVYDSVADTKEYGFNRGHVANVCRSIDDNSISVKRHKGFVFSYRELESDIVIQRLSKPQFYKPDNWRE